MSLVAGLFVGGAARRFGGVAKGLLPGPSGAPLVRQLAARAEALGARCVLVGRHPAYAALPWPALDDDPPGCGPLGGLRALLRHAGAGPALALACDLPHVSLELLRALATHPSAAPAVAPRRAARWEPLCARYEPARVLPALDRALARGRHALQPLLDELEAEALPLDEAALTELDDWDSPEDRARRPA